MKALILTFAFAIASAAAPGRDPCVRELGKLIAGIENIPRSENNPGALRSADGFYFVFDSPAAGWEALFHQIERLRRHGKSWLQIIRLWSQVPDKFEAAIAPKFSCIARPLGAP